MNILKSLLKLFVRTELAKRREELKQKLNTQIMREGNQSVTARNLAYLAILDSIDGKGIDAIEKAIDKM